MPRLIIKPPTAIFFGLLMLTYRNISSFMPLLAAITHEIGHLAALKLLRYDVGTMEITLFGAEIRSPGNFRNVRHAAVVYGAGPAVNILCSTVTAPFWNQNASVELFGISGIVLAAVNLMPIHALDGGCILESILISFIPDYTFCVSEFVSGLFLALLWLACSYLLLVSGGNLSLMLFCLCMFFELYMI